MTVVSITEMTTIVARQLGTRLVKPEHLLMEDLGAESVDLVSIIAVINDKYQTTIDETDLLDIRTVSDLYELTLRTIDKNAPTN